MLWLGLGSAEGKKRCMTAVPIAFALQQEEITTFSILNIHVNFYMEYFPFYCHIGSTIVD